MRAILFGQLTKLLESLGFVKRSEGAYRHAASDTLLLLNWRDDQEAASPADVVAVRKQLVERGLIEAAEFDTRVDLVGKGRSGH